MADKNHLKCIGVVGLGNMGNALAGALLAHGFRVAVWNRTGSKAAPLVEKGAMLAGSAAEAAEMSDVTVVCVAEHAVIAAVVQTNEVAQAIRGKALLQLGVVTAEQAAETADWAGRHDVDYLEGSILGVPDNVADGTATLVCSGPTQQFDALRPVLEAFGTPHHLSENIGAAYEFDKVVYPFGYGTMLGFIQGAAMAKASGYSIIAYTKILTEWMKPLSGRLETFGSLIAEEDFHAHQATLEAWAAGYEKSLDACRALGVDDALPTALMVVLRNGIDRGYGDEEILAVFKTLIPKP
jgi:3-hydroxyisobutyrate dehydrogenase-like beta-hydroxyacid dehydrogenase